MSLVYAKKSDEIGCAHLVFLHAAVACGTKILMSEGYQESQEEIFRTHCLGVF